MGMVIRFPRQRCHARTPSSSASLRAARLAKASKVISDLPRSAAKRTTPGQWGLGMPLERQPLTVESDCVRALATSPVPPPASITASQVRSMDAVIVRNLRTCQEFATRETTFSSECGAIGLGMDSNDIIAARLKGLRKVLNIKHQSEFAKKLGIEKNTYNPFEKGTRPLTFETASLIRRRFGVPIDWLFFGDAGQISREMLLEASSEAEKAVASQPGRRKAPRSATK